MRYVYEIIKGIFIKNNNKIMELGEGWLEIGVVLLIKDLLKYMLYM